MSIEALEQVKQGLKAGDPKEILELMDRYCNDALTNINLARVKGGMLLSSEEPKEADFDQVKKLFDEAAECLLNASYIFNLDCLIDLLNCEY